MIKIYLVYHIYKPNGKPILYEELIFEKISIKKNMNK